MIYFFNRFLHIDIRQLYWLISFLKWFSFKSGAVSLFLFVLWTCCWYFFSKLGNALFSGSLSLDDKTGWASVFNYPATYAETLDFRGIFRMFSHVLLKDLTQYFQKPTYKHTLHSNISMYPHVAVVKKNLGNVISSWIQRKRVRERYARGRTWEK